METENYQNQVNQNPSAPQQTPPPPPAQTSLGLQQNVACLLAYLFGWIGGLIFLLAEKDNKFVKFHAAQSLISSIAAIIVLIILGAILGAVGAAIFAATLSLGILSLFSLLSGLLWLAYAVLVIFMMIKSYKGEKFKLPIIGNIAENIAK